MVSSESSQEPPGISYKEEQIYQLWSSSNYKPQADYPKVRKGAFACATLHEQESLFVEHHSANSQFLELEILSEELALRYGKLCKLLRNNKLGLRLRKFGDRRLV